MVACLLVSSCTVTTYGFKPEETGPGKYAFTLYYNEDATDEIIDSKASEIVETIRSDNNFSTCTYTRSEMMPPWRNKEIDVIVSCN